MLWVLFGVVVVGAIVVAGAASLGTLGRALSARPDLLSAKDTLQQVADNPTALESAGGRAHAEAQIRGALVTVDAVQHKLHHSLAVSAARFVPFVRTQRDGLVTLVGDTDVGARTALALLQEVDALTARSRLTSGQVPLEAIGRLGADASHDGDVMHGLVHSTHGMVSELATARAAFDRVAAGMGDRLRGAGEALQAADSFMGGSSTRHYLLAIENNAEMRDQGSILSYATVTFSAGRLSVEGGGSVEQIPLAQDVPVPLPSGTAAVFGSIHPTGLWQSVNASADFAWSGMAMTAMFGRATGQPVDGVVAADVPALSALLRVVGPVSVPGIAEPVTADDAARILLHDQYRLTNRRADEEQVAAAVVDRLAHGRFDVVVLGRALADAAAGGHIRLFSTAPGEERAFERTGLGGGPAPGGAVAAGVGVVPTFHLAVENRTATKLDYYVTAGLEQSITLTPYGTAIVRSTVTLVNAAPTHGESVYQVGPDAFGSQRAAGDYVAWVLLWGPAGATQPGSVPESGLRLTPAITTVPAGQSGSVTFETIVPNAVRNGRLVLRYVPQPRLAPENVTLTLSAPGWVADGSLRRSFALDRTESVAWTLHR